MDNRVLKSKILKLKEEKNAIILAHNYQIDEVQEIADIVGDSLKLSQEAAKTDKDIIVFCGVRFMAETAKMLSPNKKVILANKDAGCPMADMVNVDKLKDMKKKHPMAKVVCYVNSSAEVKKESHICCTSSNAVRVVQNLDSKQILFIPDKNLGNFVQKNIKDKEFFLMEGYCPIHENVVTVADMKIARNKYPKAKILVHPECKSEVVELADFVGSTEKIIKYVKKSSNNEFVIGTEIGIMYKLKNENPNKKFYKLSSNFICKDMKKTKLKDVYNALLSEEEIKLSKEIIEGGQIALNNMFKLS